MIIFQSSKVREVAKEAYTRKRLGLKETSTSSLGVGNMGVFIYMIDIAKSEEQRNVLATST